MAIPVTALKYGWAILATITLGTTIFVVNNTRHQVKNADVVEVILGIAERVEATRYQTNLVVITTNHINAITNDIVTEDYTRTLIEITVTNACGTNKEWYISVVTNYTTNTVVTPETNVVVNTVTEYLKVFDYALAPYGRIIMRNGKGSWVLGHGGGNYTHDYITNIYSTNLIPGEYYVHTNYGTNYDLCGNPIAETAYITNTWQNEFVSYTNTMTNTFGNYVEWDMIEFTRNNYNNSSIRTSILKALIPCFADPDTIGDGKDIQMLTVTGLFAKLNIGNGTNFTWAPGWTNTVTNYFVCYTNPNVSMYYNGYTYSNWYESGNPGTNYYVYTYQYYFYTNTWDNGIRSNWSTIAVTQNYHCADYVRVYTNELSGGGTNPYIYRIVQSEYMPLYTNAIFNTPTVRTITNAAVYFSDENYGSEGYWEHNQTPKVIHQVYLEEMYKCLQAMQYIPVTTYAVTNTSRGVTVQSGYTNYNAWTLVKADVDGLIFTQTVSKSSGWPSTFSYGATHQWSGHPNYYPAAVKSILLNSTLYCRNVTALDGDLYWYVALTNPPQTALPEVWWGYPTNLVPVYNANGAPNTQNGPSYEWGTASVLSNGTTVITKDISAGANWCAEPSEATGQGYRSGIIYYSSEGFTVGAVNLLFKPTFYYCTDKYW